MLTEIVNTTRTKIIDRKKNIPLTELVKSIHFNAPCYSLREYITNENLSGIIAEFKRRSPSKGIINNTALVKKVTTDYKKYGASAISVLTDEIFFGGSMNDLVSARVNEIPILRKDFIIDEYQILESKAFGADIILLIAACLKKKEVRTLTTFAKNTGLEVLLEIHNEKELDHIFDQIDVVGINNRDLKSFRVDINHSIELGNKIPSNKIKIAESGIKDVDTIRVLREHGFKGFLMGEKFMKEKDPGLAFKKFVEEL